MEQPDMIDMMCEDELRSELRDAVLEIERLRHDNKQIIQNCMTIAEVEEAHKKVICQMMTDKSKSK